MKSINLFCKNGIKLGCEKLNKLLFVLIFVVCASPNNAQTFCFTQMELSDPEYYVELRNMQSTGPYYIKIYIHVITRTDYTGGQSYERVLEAVNHLNEDYRPHNIFFIWDWCVDYINNDAIFGVANENIFNVNGHQDGVDIYLFPDTAHPAGGSAKIDGTAFFVAGTFPDGSKVVGSKTISHEMGHILGLLHTHHSCDINDNWELTNGSNCLSKGDRICDTPADPNMDYNINITNGQCVWTRQVSINCTPPEPIQSYNPAVDNIMAYTKFACMNRFTPEQGEFMRNTIAMKPYLQLTFTSPITPCGCTEQDVVISESQYIEYRYTRALNGNISVNQGGTLNIVNANILFGSNKSIIVKDGGRLIISNSTLDKCSNVTNWGGIKVESGGVLTILNSTIKNSIDIVHSKAGSTLSVDGVTMSAINSAIGNGFLIESNVNIIKMKNIKIRDIHTAVNINNFGGKNKLFTIDGGEIKNVKYGIVSTSRSMEINLINMFNVEFGILLYYCPGTTVKNTNVEYKTYGILGGWSPYLWLEKNQIGIINQNQIGNVAITLWQSGNSIIYSNPNIEAKELGIQIWQSPLTTITHNIIKSHGDNSLYGGGLKLNSSNNCRIEQNYFDINLSSFGIETVSSTGTIIIQNQLDYFSGNPFRTAGIRSMGSTEEIIDLNNVYGMGSTCGILAQNSSFNKYICNVIESENEGLGIYYNSENQAIKGNIMDCATDLSISSVIGFQFHNGNQFFGGVASANGLNPIEIENSQFYVNSNIITFMPEDIIPTNDWFFHQDNGEFFICEEQAGPTWTPFNGNNPLGICAYFEYLKSIKNTRPSQFKVKMIHLVKYLKKQKNLNFPDCIKTDSTYLSLCGLSLLADVAIAVESLGNYNVNGNQIKELQDQYFQDTSSSNHLTVGENLKTEIETRHEEILDRIEIEKSNMDSLQIELNNLICSDTLIKKWSDVYRIYLEYIGTDSLSSTYRNELVSLSRECSDLYGDVIHLARAMTNTFSTTYFDVFDGCGTEHRNTKKKMYQDITLYPNPSNGKINISFQDVYNGILDITDVSGRLILKKEIKNMYIFEIDLINQNGVYICRFTDDQGNIVNKKIIVID